MRRQWTCRIRDPLTPAPAPAQNGRIKTGGGLADDPKAAAGIQDDDRARAVRGGGN